MLSQLKRFTFSVSLLPALALSLLLLVTILLTSGPASVEAGKKQKMLMGLAVGHALHSRARDASLLRLIIPLRIASEAWKHFGKFAAHHDHHDHYDHHHHGGHYGGHHHDHFGGLHHFPEFEHEFGHF